ncbi:MAG: NUDIX domain-containing protein [Candidatus Sulfobium sp.]
MDMTKLSAGLLLYRFGEKGEIEVLLVHPGGPFWAKKDLGAWSIPKGLISSGEDPLEAAKREFGEETGLSVSGRFVKLAPVKVHTKIIEAWAVEGDCDPENIRSNTFMTEWPPKSGKQQEFPEVDRAAWFGLEKAGVKINRGQAPLLEELRHLLKKKA